jgi:Mrp family chromosome partitioning ATPase
VPATSPDPRAADAYLRLAAHVLLEERRRSFRSVGVVSALRGEGKTTAALNLAICLGRACPAGQRVLLVDADARSRALTRLLGGSVAEGSAKATAQGWTLAATAFPGLDILVGPPARDALSLQTPDAWAEAMPRLTAGYGLVVVDCPSVLDDPDGVVLREAVDALVMVVRAGRTPRRTVERALAGSRRPVVGVLLAGLEGAA